MSTLWWLPKLVVSPTTKAARACECLNFLEARLSRYAISLGSISSTSSNVDRSFVTCATKVSPGRISYAPPVHPSPLLFPRAKQLHELRLFPLPPQCSAH